MLGPCRCGAPAPVAAGEIPAAEDCVTCASARNGGLLIACEPEHAGAVQAAFHAEGHAEAVVIGEMIDSDGPVRVSVG